MSDTAKDAIDELHTIFSEMYQREIAAGQKPCFCCSCIYGNEQMECGCWICSICWGREHDEDHVCKAKHEGVPNE